MRVCVVGSGGREHALAHVLGRHHDVVVTPGNPGIPGSVPTPPEELAADLIGHVHRVDVEILRHHGRHDW